VPSFQENGGRWTKGIYMKLAKHRRNKGNFSFGEWEKLSSNYVC
jgi:hypothetical protein